MRLPRLLALAALFLSVGDVAAQDVVENPEFTSWSKFKKGTSVTIKSVSTIGKTTSEVIVTTTLVEVGPDKIVLESVVKTNGTETKLLPTKRETSKTTKLPVGVAADDFASGKPPGTTAMGIETLKIGNVEVKTRWYKFTDELAGTKTDAKTWLSDEIPGRTVKIETVTTGKLKIASKLEVIDVKKP